MVSGGQEKPHQAHIAVLGFPFGSHPAPLHALAWGLAAAAPTVCVSFFCSAKANSSLPHGDRTPENLKLYDVDDGAPTEFTINPPNPDEEVERFMKVSPGNFRDGIERAVKDAGGARISCVVSDAFLWFAADLALEMGKGVPWVALWTGGARSLSAHLYTDALRSIVGVGKEVLCGEAAAMAAKVDADLGFLPGMSGARLCDLPEGVVSGNLSSEFARLLHRTGTELPRAAAVAINTFQGLDTALTDDLRAKFKDCHLIGPLNLLSPLLQHYDINTDDPAGCLRWLDRQPRNAVAYVNFCPPPGELAELAEGLDSSGIPFLWSLRESQHVHLPAGFLERIQGRGMVVASAPQPLVLAHPATGAFVTHGEWNSVVESLAGGVPMVCRPFVGDQRLTARTVASSWGVGVEIAAGKMTKAAVAEALKTVMRSEEGKKMRERACALAEAAKKAVRPDGSSVEGFRALLKTVSGSAINV